MPILSRFLALPALLLALPPLAARADCVDDAAARHGINAGVLRAIGWQESRLRPMAFHRNADGSVDLGAFQINSVHLPELAALGVTRDALDDGCVSADVAAWHYRRQIDRLGDTWFAVGAYHSLTRARAAWYANRIAAILMRWRWMPAGPLPFAASDTLAPDPPRRVPPPRPAAARSPVQANAPLLATDDAIAFLPPAR